MKKVRFKLESGKNYDEVEVNVSSLCIIGYSGRNIKKTLEHINELSALGVEAPKSVPEIYRCGTSILTQDKIIETVGRESSGEIEFIFFKHYGELYIGIGSDQTDRSMESYHMKKSKQVCQKPIGTTIWKYEDLKNHWDRICLTSWQTIDGEEVLYQKGTAADILPLEALYSAVESFDSNMEDRVIFSGTVPLIAGFKYGSSFRGCIEDPVLNRSLNLSYDIRVVAE